MNLSLSILNELARSKSDIINKIDNISDNIIHHLILCCLYTNNQEYNHWKKEIFSSLNHINKLKNNKYPTKKQLDKWILSGFNDTLNSQIDIMIKSIMNDYTQINYDKNKIVNVIFSYFDWLLNELSINGIVYNQDIYDKIDSLVKKVGDE